MKYQIEKKHPTEMVWLMNPDGRAVCVPGATQKDPITGETMFDRRTRRALCVEGTVPEFEKALIGEHGWRLADPDEIKTQKQADEATLLHAMEVVEQDTRSRYLRAGVAPQGSKDMTPAAKPEPKKEGK